MLTMHVSWSLFFFFFLFFLSVFSLELLRKPVLNKCCSVCYEGSFSMENGLKNPQRTSRRVFLKKKKKRLNCGSKNMAPFSAYMGKNISWVRIAKCAIPNSDFLPIFTTERSEPHLSGVCKFWSYRHCKSLFLLIKKQKV